MIYKKDVEVKLIPWVHHFGCQSHDAVIEFIKKLPKNSTIALEITFRELNFGYNLLSKIQKVIAEPIGQQQLKTNIDNYFHNLKEEQILLVASMIEVIQACAMRNIKIVPIDSRNYKNQYMRRYNRGTEETLSDNILREQHFANQIKTILKKYDKDKLFVITGSAHSISLKDILNHSGINTTLQKTIPEMTDEEYYDMIRLMGSVNKEEQRKLAGKIKLKYLVMNFSSPLTDKKYVPMAIERIWTNAITLQNKQSERTKRNLKISKNKQELKRREIKPK